MQIGLIALEGDALNACAQWAIERGLTVLSQSGLVVHLEGDVRDIADALKVDFADLEGGWHADRPATLPECAVGVSGLSTKGRLYPHARAHKLDNPLPPLTTNGPHPGLTPSQVLAGYQVTGTNTGHGQTIAVLEWGGSFQQSDLDANCTAFGLPPLTVTVIPLNGYQNTFSPATGLETTLDLVWAHFMAPDADIRAYMAPMGTDDAAWGLQVTTALNAVLTDPVRPTVLSISYGDGEDQFPASDLQAWEHLIAAITAQGTTVLISSGDQGSYGLHQVQLPQIQRVSGPASCPSAVAVGATALYMNDLTFETEVAWTNDLNSGASGGGFSTVFPRPSYQDGLSPQPAMRGVPDLSAVGAVDTEAFLVYDGQYYMVAGTSLSAPVVAGLLTRVAQAKGSPLGDIHALLYQRGSSLCRDITVGNNQCYATPGFETQPGWDPVTGWGSPNFPEWMTLLAPSTEPAANVNPSTLTVAQLATTPEGSLGVANIPLQHAAQTLTQSLASANLFGMSHRPTGWFNAGQQAAAQLWDAGVRS